MDFPHREKNYRMKRKWYVILGSHRRALVFHICKINSFIKKLHMLIIDCWEMH